MLGHASSPNATRGVFRSSDGGRSWQNVLFISEGTGSADLAIDPADPRVLHAASWSYERKPWAFENGSTDGGIFKSEDGGDTWTRLAGGLPSGVLGRTAVTISPAIRCRRRRGEQFPGGNDHAIEGELSAHGAAS